MRNFILASVPYALKAADFDSLGGLTASSFAPARNIPKVNLQTVQAEALAADDAVNFPITGGMSGYLFEFSASSSIIDSPIFANTAGLVGHRHNGSNWSFACEEQYPPSRQDHFPKVGAATVTAGFGLEPLDLYAYSYNASLKGPEYSCLQVRTEVAEHRTASPSITLHLPTYDGVANSSETALSFDGESTTHFAPG